MESFLPQAGIDMHYYDQLSCNGFDPPDDPSLWTVARYTAEVEEVYHATLLKSPICASRARLKAGRAVQRST
jgi:hypothetical protein